MSRSSLNIVSLGLLMTCLLCSCAHQARTDMSPGVTKNWNNLIEELEIVQPFNLNDYSKIVVTKLDTSATPLPSSGDKTYQPTVTVLKSASQIFTAGLRGQLKEGASRISVYGPDDNSPAAGPDVLLFRGRVTELNPGSKAIKYVVGFGPGKTVFEIVGEIIDARSNKPLLRFRHARSSGIGTSGGNNVKFLAYDIQDVGEDIGKMLLSFDGGPSGLTR